MKFDHFVRALRALCRQHHVVLAPTVDGRVGISDVAEGDEPVADLVDLTRDAPTRAADVAKELPDYFLTLLTAKQASGFVGYSMLEPTAHAMASGIQGARVVQIGPPNHVRGWAVIRPLR